MAMINIENLTVSYGKGETAVQIVNSVTFQVAEGDRQADIGQGFFDPLLPLANAVNLQWLK